MAGSILRFPVSRHYISDARRFAYRISVRLEVQAEIGQFMPVPFRLDTGSDFMTIPQWMARQNGIPFSEETGLFPKTAAGRAAKPSFISPVAFAFPQLPEWQFGTVCVFSPYDLPYCLLALRDFVPHFLVRSNKRIGRLSRRFGCIAAAGRPRRPAALAAPTMSTVKLDEQHGTMGSCSHWGWARCCDKGFLPMPVLDYLQLLNLTAGQSVPGKRGATPAGALPIVQRLQLSPTTWWELVSDFGRLFSTVAARQRTARAARSRHGRRRFHLTRRVRELLSDEA